MSQPRGTMNRRAFIKGMVAIGVLTLTPLEPICAVFRPKYMTATDIIRKNKEYRQQWKKEWDRTVERLNAEGRTDISPTLFDTPDIKWFSLDGYE